MYTLVAEVPPTSTKNERYDILGVVIHMEETRRMKTTHGHHFDVRDITVVDQSVKRLGEGLVISLYRDLATKDCTKLAAWCESFMVVSFLHLQPAAHKGFSLSSMSTTINSQPTRPEVNALKAWILENKDKLADHVAHELQIREALSPNILTSVAEVKNKTPMTTTAYERHWLTITISNARPEDVNAYIGCSGCRSRCDYAEDVQFYCDKCFENCSAEQRVTFTFFATDGSDTLRLTAYGKECEKLLNHTAGDLIEFKKNEEWPEFANIAEKLKSKPTKVQIGPTGAIKRVGYLKWVIKAISLE
ncbi:Replication protein A 70 kDa DNA-binding subunit B [Bienertia sinuspersici]